MKTYLTLCLLLTGVSSYAQNDINNLIHTKDYAPSRLGELGEVKSFGSGDKSMILIPGWGFDYTIFESFIKSHEGQFTMYAITIPGFGNTQAPPMPPEGEESYGKLNWTNGVLKGITDLIQRENLNDVVLVTCFTYAEVLAMKIALSRPEKISKVIIIGGAAKLMYPFPSYEPRTLEQRVAYIDNVLSKSWFKTVTKQTWDNGNFAPETFAKDSVKAKQYWDQMSAVPIPVMVRYLCEFYSTDVSLEYDKLQIPILAIIPAFDGETLKEYPYLTSGFHQSWIGAKQASDNIHLVTLMDSRAFVMVDWPEKVNTIIQDFLDGKTIPPVK